MRAIILAAGRGSRLAHYSDDRPKSLNTIGGIPIIERQIAVLRGQGVGDITLITGYRADQLVLPGTRQIYNPDWQSTNMVESLFCAVDLFDRPCIVAYADIIYEPKVLTKLLDSADEASVIVDQNWRAYWEWRFDDPLADAESLRLTEANRITEIGNRVIDIDEIQAQYIGLMMFSCAGLENMQRAHANMLTSDRDWKRHRDVRQAYMTDLLMEMISLDMPIQGVPIEGGWLEFDTTEDYERVQKLNDTGRLGQFMRLNEE